MKKYVLFALLIICYLIGFSQNRAKFESTINVGSLTYFVSLVMVKPGENWQGYYLPREPGTGILIASSNGFCLRENFHFGVGVGYANIKGISGLMVNGDIRIDFSKKPFSTFLYINPGYSHFWNQYKGGTDSMLFDFGFGGKFKVINSKNVMISVGLLSMQMNTYFTSKVGFTF